jgi:hypothetical protein
VPEPKKRLWCEQNFLDSRFLKRAGKNRRALARLLTRLQIELLSVDTFDNREMLILKALLCGLFMQIAMMTGQSDKLGFL